MAFLGPWEIALIIVILLLLFGPKKLPKLAQYLGKAVRKYRKAREYRKATSLIEEFAEEPVKTIFKPLTAEEPPPKPRAEAKAESRLRGFLAIKDVRGPRMDASSDASRYGNF
jgi:sec-independent protein translocase protein TatA